MTTAPNHGGSVSSPDMLDPDRPISPDGTDQQPPLDPTIWTPIRQELRKWFAASAPSLLEPYEGAVTLLHKPQMPARVYLVSHLVRDIYNKLPEILDGSYQRKNSGEIYKSQVEKIKVQWKVTPSSPSTNNPSAEVTIPNAAANTVEILLQKHEGIISQPNSSEALVRALYRQFAETESEPPYRVISSFVKMRKWFTHKAHLVNNIDNAPDEKGLIEKFEHFEYSLYAIVGSYFKGKEVIDDILQRTNQ